MSEHEVKIGAGDWWSENPKRIGIYNANYIGYFEKYDDKKKPWCLVTPSGHEDQGKKFETYEEAAAYVRDRLSP